MSSPPDTLKVCIVGQNASLKFGGEASTPWFFFKYLRAQNIDTHLVVHGRTESEIRAAFPNELDRIHTVSDTRLDRFLFRLGRFLPPKIDAQTLAIGRHLVTQLRQRKVIRHLIAEGKVNIVHEATPVAPRQISAIHSLGVPVIIGPLSGGMTYPPAFRFMESRVARFVEIVGRGLSQFCNLLIPGKRRAAALLVANDLTLRSLPWFCRGRIYRVSEIGVDLDSWNAPAHGTEGAIRFVYLGRLADWKGVTFLVDAFKPVADQLPNAYLEIIGDGPERQPLEHQAAALGLTDRIRFHGFLLPTQSAPLVRQCDALVLPSLHECGGMVVLEAMAVSLPVIATNWAGPGVHVTDETGIRVAPDSRRSFVDGLTTAMLTLAKSPELRKKMGDAARERIISEHYDWKGKINEVMEIYRQTLAAQSR